MELAEEIVKFASINFGINEYWHKKIVRAGKNTICSFNENPSDRVIQDEDIVFLDFGPIFDGYEADLGRTYVIGNNPLKLKLRKDIEAAWKDANSWISAQSTLTGAECFDYVIGLAARYGWEFGGVIAGHIVGPFPHEQAGAGNWSLDIHPENHADIFLKDKHGNSRNWILEIQFVDKTNNIGGFYEQLMT